MTTKRGFFLAVFLGFISALGASALAAKTTAVEYLSDSLSDRIVSVVQDWGDLGFNTAVRPGHRAPMSLRIKDKKYLHGLGHHANGEIVVDLGGRFKTFRTDVGIQWQGGHTVASVIFRIYVDDKKVFDSGIMRENDPPRTVTVSVEGGQELRLVADDAGDGITCDCANWADARLARNPAAQTKPPVAAVDIVPFGQVATWDPAIERGTAASRVEEFPAADVHPARDILPAADGTFGIPQWRSGGCIGMHWHENRILRKLLLRFGDVEAEASADSVKLEYWTGESAWQGRWEAVDARAEKVDGALLWSLPPKQLGRGTQKVRWVFSGARQPHVVKAISAYTRSRWETIGVRIESVARDRGNGAEVDLYNGVMLGPAGSSLFHRSWDGASPLSLQVRAAITPRYKADRTVLRFRFPNTAFGVAVEDLKANDCVYVPHAGLFVTRLPAPVSREEYLKRIAAKRTVLAEVRRQPDQDFARAMAVVHNPVQDFGPMMLSLACDNRKYVIQREGIIQFDRYERPDEPPRDFPTQWQLVPHFGAGKTLQFSRRLRGGWFPIPETTACDGDVVYRQATYVAPVGHAAAGSPASLRERAVCVAEYAIENTGDQPADVSLALEFASQKKQSMQILKGRQGLLVTSGDRLLALLAAEDALLSLKMAPAGVVLSGKLPPKSVERCVVLIPAWNVGPAGDAALDPAMPWESRTRRYWEEMLAPAMQVDVPDALLNDVIRASQVHIMLAARNEDRGARVSPWISSDRYGPLESESNSIIRGMDMMGHADFARRSLEFFVSRYNKAGYLTTGYTMVGTGEHLWTMAEHWQRTNDRSWAAKIAPEVARACRWIVCQRAKTKLLDVHGQKAPEYGLMPPGVAADWNRYAFRFFSDAQYCAGLEAAGRMLADIGEPSARALLKDAADYRQDLLRAYLWTQARSPVVRLDDGAWTPNAPAMLACFGRVDDLFPGEDGNRSWCYGVELGAHHLAALKILDPASDEVRWDADYLEDVQFLRSGMGDYPEVKNRTDPFCFGGFSKVQPYYCRLAEVYALRDDVKPFVRAYFNAIPALLSRENLSFWEHFHNLGGWNKTHETGWFLCQTRAMFVAERGRELWLAPMVTNRWLKDGMKVSVRDAPTRFGKVSYTLRSAVARGEIEATIEPPQREPPARIVIRLRHPDGKPIRSVTVQGKRYDGFDPQKDTVSVATSEGSIVVRAQY